MVKRVAASAALALLVGSAPASAQVERADRAFHGLFGSPSPDPDRREIFDASVSLFGAYEGNILGNSLALNEADQLTGFSTGASGGLEFMRSGREFSFMVSAGLNGRYFPDRNEFISMGQQGAAGLTYTHHKTHVGVSGMVGYSPYFTLAPFAAPDLAAGALAPLPIDERVLRRQAVALGGGANVSQEVGSRGTLSATYTGSTWEYVNESIRYRSQLISGLYSHRLGRDVGLRLGYTYGQMQFAAPSPGLITKTIEASLDYHKALGLTRRTQMGFSAGTTAYRYQGVNSFHVIGDATLNHQLGRTWTAQAIYHRGIGLLEGFNVPFFSDSLTAGVGGSITHRLDFRSGLAFTRGALGVTTAPTNNLDVYSLSARLRYGLTQMVALYTEYFAYRYDFLNGTNVPRGLPARMYREGARAGLSLWLPFIR